MIENTHFSAGRETTLVDAGSVMFFDIFNR